jgi:preprotein translocase subunit SecE
MSKPADKVVARKPLEEAQKARPEAAREKRPSFLANYLGELAQEWKKLTFPDARLWDGELWKSTLAVFLMCTIIALILSGFDVIIALISKLVFR